jgi:transcriptional regulator with XRE-family HTH domain
MGSGSVAYAPPRPVAFNPPPASRRGFSQAPASQAPASGSRYGSSGQTEIGSLFRELRRALGFSLPQVANLLQTRIDVISALETGNVQALPDWSETARILSRYLGLARIDAGPVLSLIRRDFEQQGRTGGRAAPQDKRSEAPPRRRKEPSVQWAAFRGAFLQPFADAASALTRSSGSAQDDFDDDTPKEPAPPTRSGWLRLDGRKTAGLIAALFIIVAYFAQGSALQASLATLHPPFAKLMRGAQDYLLHRAAPMRDGMRWIEVDDPRSRKADKLAVRR